MPVAYKDGVTRLESSLADTVPAALLVDANAGAAAVAAAVPEGELMGSEKSRLRDQYRRGRSPYSPDTQPRDYKGKFRQVLARLRDTAVEAELPDVVNKVEEAQEAERNQDYVKSAKAATDVIGLVDRLNTDALDSEQLQNVQTVTRELGKAIAYLPLPQGVPNAKLRFSDLPPASQKLINDMEDRVREKVDPSKVNAVLAELNRFTSGIVQLSSDELQSALSRLLRYLIN